MTAGPYRPISIKSYTACIGNIYARASVDPASLSQGSSPVFTLAVDLVILGIPSTVIETNVTIRRHGSMDPIKEATIQPSSLFQSGVPIADHAIFVFGNNEVGLWWPVGYGQQPLYDVEVLLKDKARPTSFRDNVLLALLLLTRNVIRAGPYSIVVLNAWASE